jgi:hypothetical protein
MDEDAPSREGLALRRVPQGSGRQGRYRRARRSSAASPSTGRRSRRQSHGPEAGFVPLGPSTLRRRVAA